MPNYFTRASLNAIVPPPYVLEALDDNKDGVEDAGLYDELIGISQGEIDGILGKRFAVPFANPIPDVVATAARVVMARNIYKRRGYADENNPFATEANDKCKALEKIASGNDPLTPDLKRKQPSAAAITEPSRTASARGKAAI